MDVVGKGIEQALMRQVLHENDDLRKLGWNCGVLVWGGLDLNITSGYHTKRVLLAGEDVMSSSNKGLFIV